MTALSWPLQSHHVQSSALILLMTMSAPTRIHQRQSFFKYMSAATARIVLVTRKLRWSSPVLFNDPFDVPRELSFGVQATEVAAAVHRRVRALIEQPPDDTSRFEPKLRLILDTVKKGIAPELLAKMLEGLDEVAATHKPTGAAMDELRALWRSWLSHHRILCLTESPAHAAMWYHYADRYRGVVLELRCIDELDSPWLAAKPVSYPEAKPAVYTTDGWAQLVCQQRDLAIQDMLDLATYTKSPDWSYEREWRIASFKSTSDTGDYTDYGFSREELGAIYFGPMVDADEKRELLIASGAYPAARLLDTQLGHSREFQFQPTAG